ncbi:MAG: hypothetical protein IJW98_07655 [Clostridia bacterium]|nr:hypothetical protein [Clostridia bacterium]
MKESTKNLIRLAALTVCLLPYRMKRESEKTVFKSLLLEYTWNTNETPPLSIQRNRESSN